MPGKTVNSAILLLIIGNMMALISDVFVKTLSSDTPIFQFIFLRSLITILLLLPFYPLINRQALFAGWRLHTLRAHINLLTIVGTIVALGSLPLATANAIFYGAPLLVMLLAALCFGERLTRMSVIAVVSGFAGVMAILRPVEFGWGAIAALIAALGLALSALLVRRLPPEQSLVHKLLLSYLLLMPACFIAMLIEGVDWQAAALVNAAGSALFILGYNVTVLLAYRQVDASKVTSAEYTGLLGAVTVGWIWFAEVPDIWFVSGTLLVILPLIVVGWQHRGSQLRRLQQNMPDREK